MLNIFVSSERVDDARVSGLIHKLREAAFKVDHSPRAKDARWDDWYEKGCQAALDKTEIFIVAVTKGWDCSTWMAHEADEAQKRMAEGRIRQCFYYNPT